MYLNLHLKMIQFFPCVVQIFPVFSLSGKTDDQIPCFPCAVATLTNNKNSLVIIEAMIDQDQSPTQDTAKNVL